MKHLRRDLITLLYINMIVVLFYNRTVDIRELNSLIRRRRKMGISDRGTWDERGNDGDCGWDWSVVKRGDGSGI